MARRDKKPNAEIFILNSNASVLHFSIELRFAFDVFFGGKKYHKFVVIRFEQRCSVLRRFTNIFVLLYRDYIWVILQFFFFFYCDKHDVVVYNGFLFSLSVNDDFNTDRKPFCSIDRIGFCSLCILRIYTVGRAVGREQNKTSIRVKIRVLGDSKKNDVCSSDAVSFATRVCVSNDPETK